jgi:predicted nuclease of predicted toxin-antitoxin system
MLTFLIDEDIPRSTEKLLRDRGHKVLDVRDCGLRGEADEEVFRFAQKEKAVLLTGDLGFWKPFTILCWQTFRSCYCSFP